MDMKWWWLKMRVIEGAQLPASSVGPQYQKISTDVIPQVWSDQNYEGPGLRKVG